VEANGKHYAAGGYVRIWFFSYMLPVLGRADKLVPLQEFMPLTFAIPEEE
jgi:hypothetical protein